MSASLEAIVEAYMKKADWEVYENSNTNLSYSNFRNYLFDKFVKNPHILSRYLPAKAVKMHFDGDIHIHKLPDSLWIPYCAGWSLEKILRMGLKTPTVVSKPARHLDTAVSHAINFFFMAAQEWTGAVAMSAFDLYVAPFVCRDRVDPGRIKQVLQGMLFELNYPARAGYQSPFTNITLVMDTSKELLKGAAIVGGEPVGTLGDYLDEALLVDEALMELYTEGDGVGQPFTFPIPTIMLTRDFDWNGRRWGELVDRIFEALARRGAAYLLNGYATNVEALYAMCCRLTIDTSRITNNCLKLKIPERLIDGGCREETEEYLRKHRHAYGIWALPDATGSIGVVTINLPRLAVESRGEWDALEELLMNRLEVARDVLLTWRDRYEKSLEAGLMPLTKTYLGHFWNHFSTFGLIGLPEAAANFLREPKLWFEAERRRMLEAASVMKRIVSFVRKVAEEYEEEDGFLYNVEEVPGESTAYRLAMLDYARYKERVESGEVCVPGDETAFFYSNSIVPYYADVPIYERAELEGEVQREFTGGVMMHLFLGESPDPGALKKLVRNIALNTKVVYFSITPALSVCRKCGWSGVGVFDECPKCSSPEVDIWSRIVGYYRPVRNWNVGKRAEFKLRVHYSL